MAVVASPESGTSSADDRPADDPAGRRRRAVVSGWWLAGLAALTVLLGLAIPLAPVTASDPVVTWPKAGQPATPTALPLVPYRPLSIRADVPCDALRGGGDGLRTEPESAGSPGRGLVVAASGGRVTVTSSGETLVEEVLPLQPCRYRITADGTSTRVERDGVLLAERPGALVPQVAELDTDAPTVAGLSATVRPDDRYASVPGTLKLVLLVGHLLALVATIAFAYRRWRARSGTGSGLVRPRRHGADLVVVAVSALWVVFGPLQNDDSWYLLMARNATPTGYIGNQIYMFNATENPFVLSQYVMAVWGHLGDALGMVGWGLLWMRILPLLLGLLTWWLLRALLATSLGRVAQRDRGSTAQRNRTVNWVPWSLLVAHLAWWLPYGMALRPEVFIVPLAAGVMVLAELARRAEAVGPLVPATALAALAVSISPSGLVAAAPVVVALPWLWRWLAVRGWRSRLGVVGAVIAAGTVAIPVGFGDATLGDVVETTDVHSWYYLTFPWFEEWAHYRTMIETGTWGRRLPVLLTVVLLVVVAIGSGRQGPTAGGRLRQEVMGTAVTTAVALGLLAFGPTKWVNHFGAVAASATVLLALCLLRTPLPRRPGALVTVASLGLVTGATVLGWAGPNTWKPYSDRGQPFGDHNDNDISMLDLERLSPHIGGIYLSQVWWWLLLAAAAALFVAWRRRETKRSGEHADGGARPVRPTRRRTFGVTPERSVLVATSVVLVLGMIAVMLYAPWVQRPGWTVAASQVQALVGRQCGLQNAVTAMAPVAADLGAPVGPEQRTGDFALAARDRAPVPPPGPGALWHSEVETVPGADPGAITGLGTLTTPWYPVPPSSADDPEAPSHVVVPVAGNTPEKQRVVVQFGAGPPGTSAPVPTTSVVAPSAAGLTAREWQEVPVQLPGTRPTFLRVIAEDRVAGADSSFAVAQPHLSRMQPIETVVADAQTRGAGGPGPDTGSSPREPSAQVGGDVFADQLSAALWPCVDQVAVHDGIAPTPRVRLQAAENTPDYILTNPTYESWGGTMVQSERTWSTVRVFSAVTPGGPPTLQWGNVDRIVYDHPTDNYDLTVGEVTRGGLMRFPTLAGEAYSGREYLG